VVVKASHAAVGYWSPKARASMRGPTARARPLSPALPVGPPHSPAGTTEGEDKALVEEGEGEVLEDGSVLGAAPEGVCDLYALRAEATARQRSLAAEWAAVSRVGSRGPTPERAGWAPSQPARGEI
jgi:hypothetical protein